MLTTLLSCSPGDLLRGAAGAALGGGGGVSATANVGREVTQGVRVDNQRSFAPQTSIRPNARVDTVDNSVNSTEIDPLLIALLILGWLAPSPGEIGRGIRKLWRRE